MKANSTIATILYLYSACSLANFNPFVDENDGLLDIQSGGNLILSSRYVFWGKDWAWAHQSTKFRRNAAFSYAASGINKSLNFELTSEIQKINDAQMTWSFDLDAKELKSDVIGGGIVFKLDIFAPGNDLGKPVLLPNNKGWKWGDIKHKGIEVRFEPALASVFFERGSKSEIRAFFYRGKIPKGKRHYTMTATLFGDIKIKPTLSERFGTINWRQWPKDPISWQSFPIDLSFLNTDEKPAGKHGFVKARGDELVFADGTRTRFWGTNITAATLFQTSKVSITKQAKRLSAMGFNLVRLHHHDSPWVNPNIFGSNATPDTQNLRKESLDKLDWWVKSLKDEGIYVWLDLHVQRNLTPKDDIFAFDEIRKNKNKKGVSLKGFNYVNPTIKNAMKQFNRAYVTHVNPYTNLAYKDEPAIIAMLLTNENDVTSHYGNLLLPDKNVPRHNKIYMQEAKVFAKQHGLPAAKTWRSWEHGPSKLFLNDLEHRFNKEMISDLREIGVKVPIVTTNTWGKNPLASLPALTAGDIIDAHSYGGVLELEKNPLITPNMTSWLSAAQLKDKPTSVTEWNIAPFPTPDRHVSSLLIASKASHQGWDALMQYAYAQNSLNKVGEPSNWHSHNDPALLATLPAAALLYRNEHVKEASTTYYLSPGATLFNEEITPKTSVAIRTASEKGKLLIAMPKTKSLPWLKPSTPPVDAIIIKDYKKSVIKQGARSVTSDTGELYRNWDEGIYTINTKQSQAVMGWVGDKSITLADTEFKITTRNATIAVQSLNDSGISQSNNILISISTNSVPYRDLNNSSKLPFLSEPIQGSLSVRAPKGLHLSYITGTGVKHDMVVNYSDGQYIIELNGLPVVHWLQLFGTL